MGVARAATPSGSLAQEKPHRHPSTTTTWAANKPCVAMRAPDRDAGLGGGLSRVCRPPANQRGGGEEVKWRHSMIGASRVAACMRVSRGNGCGRRGVVLRGSVCGYGIVCLCISIGEISNSCRLLASFFRVRVPAARKANNNTAKTVLCFNYNLYIYKCNMLIDLLVYICIYNTYYILYVKVIILSCLCYPCLLAI